MSGLLRKYPDPLDERRAKHLLRRTCYGITPERMRNTEGATAQAAVDALFKEAAALKLPEAPDENLPAGEFYSRITRRGLKDGLREKMAHFWHGHFVTSIQSTRRQILFWDYWTLLRTEGLGNFRAFTTKMGIDGAMLAYLNGTENEKGTANENYARELLELFTLGLTDRNGEDNYSEFDIREIARACTGYKVDPVDPVVTFHEDLHDGTEKTIFGVTGKHGYYDAVRILFEQKSAEIAWFVASKLCFEFLHPDVEEALILELSEVLLANDFELGPAVRTLLESERFFSDDTIGSRVKSPLEFFSGLAIEIPGFQVDGDEVGLWIDMADAGQLLSAPPNVSGWDGDTAWLRTTTYKARLASSINRLMGREETADTSEIKRLAFQLHTPSRADAPFQLAINTTRYLLNVSPDLTAPYVYSTDFLGDLVGNPLPEYIRDGPEWQRSVSRALLRRTPWHEWTIYSEDGEEDFRALLAFILRIPEMQLI